MSDKTKKTYNKKLWGKYASERKKGGHEMGAIQRDGYMFEIEFSQIAKTAAIHVTKKGQFIDEITLPFKGNEPTQEQIEKKIGEFLTVKNGGSSF